MTYPDPMQQFMQPQMPTAPQGYAPPQQYQAPPPQQFMPQYGAPQGYPQQQGHPYAPPSQPLAQGSLDDYFAQPSTGGGAALKFPQVGVSHVGIVARPITNADVQQQTQPGTGQPAFYKDGRPKFVMKVPLRVQPQPGHEDGQAQLYVAGAMRDELVRAMAEAGAPEGPPEVGAAIQITCTGTRPSGAGMNPAKTYQIRYTRPGDAPQVAPQAGPYAVQQAPQQPQYAQPQQVQQPPAPQPAPVQQAPVQQPVNGQVPAAATQTPQPAPSAVPPMNVAPTDGLDEQQKALLAQLTGAAPQQ